MQFKHPELLYALLLLVIPIIIHLFQLRKFQKVPFTNVKFLKEVTIQTRKSSQIKKWLTLLTRLLLFASIIIAFAQPYFSKSVDINAKNETVIYLDNSFSMQANGNNGTLLNAAVQDIIEHVDENQNITVFTNNDTYKNTTLKAIKNELIQLKNSANQLPYETVLLKGKKAFLNDESTVKNLVLISDFQQKKTPFNTANDNGIITKLVQLKPTVVNNITIDSTYISKTTPETIELTVSLKNQGSTIETLPVSLYNGDDLIAKSSVNITDDVSTTFAVPTHTIFDGKILIEDTQLQYDNSLFFNIDKQDKIKVLSINEADDTFLKRIYTNNEFEYTASLFNALNYNDIVDQNLIILNELKELPNSLITALQSFTNGGGYLLIIPSIESSLSSYNQIFKNYSISGFGALNSEEKKITTINFSHPLLANVFDKKVSNFQYPKVNSHYKFNTISGASILKYEDNTAFLIQKNNVFSFSAALNNENSNFKKSPLIVPVLYNIGKQSLKLAQLYYIIGNSNTIDVKAKLLQDNILKLSTTTKSVIPLQKNFINKVEIITNEFPDESGIISVKNRDRVIKKLSYNYNRNESVLEYSNLTPFKNTSLHTSVASAIDDIKSASSIDELWKWFVIFALTFLIIETLILKFLK